MTPQKYTLLFHKDISENQIKITEVPSTRKISAALESQCKKEWGRMLIEAKATDKALWDSDVYRFESAQLSGNNIHIHVSSIPFSIRIGMNKYTDIVRKLGIKYASLGMYSSCFVITSDNQYLFVEKSDKYLTPRKFSFIGGILSKSEYTLNSGVDLFQTVLYEIEDEIGVPHRHIKNLLLKASYISANYNFRLIFEARLDKTLEDTKKIFSISNDGEARHVIGIDRSKLLEFARDFLEKDLPVFEIMSSLSP